MSQPNKPAQNIALQIIEFLCQNNRKIETFSYETGISPDQLKNTLDTPETHAALFDFLLSNDDILINFCHQIDLTPKDIWRIRKTLPGAQTDTFSSI